ncbi:alpha/beta fold hydrolase [Nostoc mirabile]|uniref:alpha/beta fold hydrolase n=1 Tax=Nostoc mirabile TaxID=2907820 RepID=UPI001E47C5A1|nr:alpha/beta fold hydrolase [Nostoc mirabile]
MPTLAENYTVIAPDMRGLGDSSKPETGYDKRTVAEDIYQLINQLGFHQINLVGHDLGGMVAYAYATAHPTEVHRLVLMEFWLPGFGLEEGMDVANGGLWHFGFHMAPKIPEMLTAKREREYLTAIASPVKVTNSRIIMPCDRKLKSSGGDGECWEQYLSVL